MKNFARGVGVQIYTFNKMIEILKEADEIKKSRGGRKDKLSIAVDETRVSNGI